MRQVVEGIVGSVQAQHLNSAILWCRTYVQAVKQMLLQVGGVQAQHLLTLHCKDCRALSLVQDMLEASNLEEQVYITAQQNLTMLHDRIHWM